MNLKPHSAPFRSLLAAAVLLASAPAAFALELTGTSAEKQTQLIRLLESAAPPQEKAVACKQLAVYGQAEAVPALAALLPDPQLSSWSRIALEVIPGPAADTALRYALGRQNGLLLVGIINSIGVRRDAQAVPGLAARLADPDPEVASAAAVALGRIGGADATKALRPALATAPGPVRSAVAQGCILSAERLAKSGQGAEAAALFDAVRSAEVPVQRKAEATRGAILARQGDGLPLLLEQLHSPEKAFFDMGLRVARELPGAAVTTALARELERTAPERQARLLFALADRQDPGVLPTVLNSARSGTPALRLAAVKVLANLGDAASVPVLLEAVAAEDAPLAKAAKTTLARLHAPGVDAALAAPLANATGALRLALIELCAQRRIEAALPAILASVRDPQPALRSAALDAVGTLGGAPQVPGLVQMLVQAPATDRGDLEGALTEVSGRAGAAAVPSLLPLTKHTDPALRQSGIHALASVGGADALAAVSAAVGDPDPAVQDEAVRTLATWANNWPDDVAVARPLLALMKSGQKRSHQVLGARGYMQYLQADKQLTDDARVAAVKDLAPSLQWPDQKQAAIALLGTLRTLAAFEQLQVFAADTGLSEDAWSAQVSLAARDLPGLTKEQRRAALQTIADKSQNPATRKRAAEALKANR